MITDHDRRRVVVVGGGLAGIAAALRCADAGARVTLLEVRPRLGGAAYSFQRDGLWLDNGQHVFLRCCTAYRELLARMGVDDLVCLQRRLNIPVLAPGGRRGRLWRLPVPAPAHLAPALARYPFLTLGERLRAVRAARALGRLDPDDPELDRRTFGGWLAEHAQSAAAVDALWDLVALPTLNVRARDASLALAVKVFRTGLLDRADAGDLGYAIAPLLRLHDGGARAALGRAGVEVRLGTRVTAIDADGGARTADGDVDADAAICAVPHERAAELLPAGALPRPRDLHGLVASPIVNVHVVYDRPVCDVSFAAGLRTPAQWIFDRTSSSGLEGGGQYLAVSLSAAREWMPQRPEQLRARFLPALRELFPRARDARVQRFHVTREHAATFCAVAGTRALRPGARTALTRVALAGAWTDTGWPATMEGAVRSGRAAADVALRAPARMVEEAPA